MKNFQGRNIAVWDAEIKKPIEECSKGWDSHDEMGISALVIFDYASMRYRLFDDKSIGEAVAILNTYDWVVGFNTVRFDWKLLNATSGVVAGRKSRDFDILREIWLSLGLNPDVFDPKTHGGYKLDDVAWDTIAMRKTGNGAAAPLMYQAGQIAEVFDYCIEDVRVEKTLFEFVANHGYVCRNDRQIFIDCPI